MSHISPWHIERHPLPVWGKIGRRTCATETDKSVSGMWISAPTQLRGPAQVHVFHKLPAPNP